MAKNCVSPVDAKVSELDLKIQFKMHNKYKTRQLNWIQEHTHIK